MALTEKQERALAGLATPGEDNQKFHAGVMPLASDEDPVTPPASEANSTKMTISLGIGIGM